MSRPIEDYALIGDCHTAALVARDGSIDWLCLPRFDSAACFAALLGTADHGFWRIAPAAPVQEVRRRYRGDTLVLETEFCLDGGGRLAVIDFMPPRSEAVDLCRIVEARRGPVPVEMELRIRFDYGSSVPWVRREDGATLAVAGPDSLRLRTPVPVHGEGLSTVARFSLAEGERAVFDLTWAPSHLPIPVTIDPVAALADTEAWWQEWASRGRHDGAWRDAVARSLITLKALTYQPTGGIVAAPTTSLPERVGGVRNWDYRYCWLRDATFTLMALQGAGYHDEARDFREWLLRAAAGSPSQLQIMYGIAGERRLPELELPWLPGYEGSHPVRIGNQASTQLQLDVYGELLDALHKSWRDLPPAPLAWNLERAVVDYLVTIWQQPDEGIWEVRGPRRHFTHSKVMAWVALDRAVKGVEIFGQPGPVEHWRRVRDQIHADVCKNGYNPARGSFVQFYGAELLDASLLMMPAVGFLPVQDPRVRGTIEAIERELLVDGFVARYPSLTEVDGLPSGEAAFLLCTFWLADCLALLGRREDAVCMFERVLDVRNDVGLLAECYDPRLRRQLGNFPQAFSHVGLINTARNLAEPHGPTRQRAEH